MFPFEYLQMFLTGAFAALKMKIKRYILGVEFSFYNHKKATIEVFNSFTELTANWPANGKRQYIDVRKNPVIKNVILEPSTNWNLSTTSDVPGYLSKYQFNCSFIYNGKRYYYRYDNSTGAVLKVTSTTDQKYFERYQAIAALQKEIDLFVAQAKANQDRINTYLKKTNRTSAEESVLNAAIVQHNFTVNTYAASLPKNIIISGSNIKSTAIGAVPVVVIVVAIIVMAAATTYTVIEITKITSATKRSKDLLAANDLNLKRQMEAAQLLQSGSISQQSYNEIVKAAMDATGKNNELIKQTTKDNGDIFSKVTTLAMVVFGGFIALKLINSNPSNSNSNGK